MHQESKQTPPPRNLAGPRAVSSYFPLTAVPILSLLKIRHDTLLIPWLVVNHFQQF